MSEPTFIRGLPIGGAWIATTTTRPVVNPFTGVTIANVPWGGVDSVELAVTAAQAAFQKTRAQSVCERAETLRRISDEIGKRREDFVRCIVNETGKPVTFAETEVARAQSTFLLASEEARRVSGDVLSMEAFPAGKGHSGFTRRFPIGIVYGLTPFNFPLNLAAHKVAPALAVGNTVILKPAPKAPMTPLLLAEVLESAGVVAGQVNVVTCSNEDAGHLIGDPRVALTSFTGSPSVGWRLKERCGRQKIVLELGGNAAAIVHEDAHLDQAVAAIAMGGFGFAGQSCISVQRVLVHQPIYERFKDMFLSHVREKIRVGDPWERSTVIGPMIDSAAVNRVRSLLERAVAGGARVLTGGEAQGLILPATVLEGATRSMEVWSQEIFAPVVVLQPYAQFEEALTVTNDSDFGLQAGVFTQDLGRAYQAFEALEVGGVLINNVPTFRVENMPYGGVKQSGFGREGLRYAMEEMSEIRSMIVKLH